jgi:hypothetical protein
MPSVVVGFVSGGQLMLSGYPFTRSEPIGGLQLVAAGFNSGMVYVGLSGGVTVNSGGMFLSGGGALDGIPLAPGGSYFIPKLGFPQSGVVNVYLGSDAACSGQARLYYEFF